MGSWPGEEVTHVQGMGHGQVKRSGMYSAWVNGQVKVRYVQGVGSMLGEGQICTVCGTWPGEEVRYVRGMGSWPGEEVRYV